MTNPTVKMTSCRPYLLKAIHEWIVANQLTPHVRVNAMVAGVKVPERYVVNGEIVLNISPMAVQDLAMESHYLAFNARFNGIAEHVHVPMYAILAIYARENGRGMMFEPETPDEDLVDERVSDSEPKPAEVPVKRERGRTHLRVVRPDEPADDEGQT